MQPDHLFVKYTLVRTYEALHGKRKSIRGLEVQIFLFQFKMERRDRRLGLVLPFILI